MLSLQCQFPLKPGAGLSIMAVLAKGLPVFFIPEQMFIPSMRDDVIHNRCRCNGARLQALSAQRISPQVPVAGSTPFAVITALGSTSAHSVIAVLAVLAAVHTAVAEIGTARIATGTLGCSWHGSPQMKSSPRSSYTEPP